MEPHPVIHPSNDALRAFALGKLNDSTAAVLMNHLDSCPDCCNIVAGLSDDDFLNRLRQARGQSSTPAPARGLNESAANPKPSLNQRVISNLPTELANNQQYEILRELGRGGMGVVYLAKNKLMDRLEVLKVVNKTLLDHPGAVERFLREIRSAAKLSHANVVAAYHALQIGELLAFAMEYIEGQDLASVVKAQGPLPIPHACFYVQQAAHGLQHAFEKQMVHRDIKPQNLILAREGKKHIVKVLDFGLAKVIREKKDDTGLTGEGRMLGTPDYIAPEQTLDAAKADIRADIYSLGCTLYYLLSGHPPFSASSLGAILVAHQMHEAKPLNLVRPEVPEELAAVVRRMMAKTPAKRYQTPLEVVQALAPFVKQGTTPKPSRELSSGAVEANPAVKKAAPVNPPPALAADAPKQPEPENVWGSLTEGSSASAALRKSAVIRKSGAATHRERTAQKKWLMGGGIGVGVLLLALVGMWAGGMFDRKVQVKTKDGILVIEVNEPNPEVLVDGETVTVTWQNGGKKAEIRVKPGTHKVEVKKDGFSVDGKDLTFKDDDRVIFTAQLLPDKPEPKPVATPPDKPPASSDPKKSDAPQMAGAAADDKGFVPLVIGRDLTGWSVDGGPAGQWVVEGNTIVGQSKDFRTRNYLLTEKDYADFVLRFDYKVEDGSHGGVAIRAIEGEKVPLNSNLIFDHPLIKLTNPAVEGKEPTGMTHWLKSPAAYWGPVEILTLPTGIWHSMEVAVRGDSCTATVDGKRLVNVSLDPAVRNNAAFVPGLGRSKGKIGFQINTGILRFRKIEIKELLPAVAPPGPPKRAAKAENSFFNEEDLTGWDGLPGYWQVKNGCIIGEQTEQQAHTFLCSKKHYRDFDLKFRVKREGGFGNSGVQFRSQINNISRFTVKGPQCEIDKLSFKVPPGSIVNEGTNDVMAKPSAAALAALAKVYKDDVFNDFHIRCIGKHVTIQVNDVTTVDGDFPSLPDDGVIAWQLNGFRPQKSVTFRIVEFTDLNAAASADGFKPLFNGKNLTGWKVFGGGTGNWKVVDGAIVGSGPMSHLFSERGDYENFHYLVETMINDRGNSGQYFRTAFGPGFPKGYEAQINSTHGDPIKTGSLYKIVNISDQLHKPNEWFTQEVIAQGDHIIIKVNGKAVVSKRDSSYKKGHFALQQHDPASVVKFRRIEVKELPANKSEALPAAKAAAEKKGFVPLFNRKDLKGWRTHPRQRGNWRVEKGVLIGSGPAVSHLYSIRGNYRNFHLIAEARINDGGNSGIYFRAPFGPILPPNNPKWPQGYEAQINANSRDPRKTGSLVGMFQVAEPPHKPNEWFKVEVIAQRNHIVIKVNDKTMAEYTDDKRLYTSGHIALQQLDATTVVEFRKIEIKELRPD